MTLSLAARCPRTGLAGAALATGLPAGGAHCLHTWRGNVAVAQGYPSPHLARAILGHLADGEPAGRALQHGLENDPDPTRRQVLVLASDGETAAHTGVDTFAWHGHEASDGLVAAANMVPSSQIVESLAATFRSAQQTPIWTRLAQALHAAALVEQRRLRPCRSAGLVVTDRDDFPLLELRVDVSDDPTGQLLDQLPAVEANLPFLRMLPTHDNRAGSFDDHHLDDLGLMPDAGPPHPDHEPDHA